MGSDNPTGADNQQERLDPHIAGYVDGEGTFHVAVQRSPMTRSGYQLVPEFHVSQRLGCGHIRENHRGSMDTTLVFVVRNRGDLMQRVIPFFEAQPLLSSKQQEFVVFARIARAMANKEHLQPAGLEALTALALAMNGGGRYRRVHRWSGPESSETICRTPE